MFDIRFLIVWRMPFSSFARPLQQGFASTTFEEEVMEDPLSPVDEERVKKP